MPIKIPDSLPARATLEGENIFVMTEYRAIHQDMRPLKLLILNLMPTKIVTETQLLRKLSNSPLQVQVELLQMASHTSQNTDADHLSSFYTTFDQIRERKFDGMIITGAPVENYDFIDVDYWPELCRIMEWTKTHVHSTLHVCWGAQAGLFYHYGIPKYSLEEKLFGVFPHTALKKQSPLFRGFDDVFYIPHSRHTENHEEDIRKIPELELLAEQSEHDVAWWLAQFRDMGITQVGLTEESLITLMENSPLAVTAAMMDEVIQDSDWAESYPAAFVQDIQRYGYDRFDVLVQVSGREAAGFVVDAVERRFHSRDVVLLDQGEEAYILLNGTVNDTLYSAAASYYTTMNKGFVERREIQSSKLMYISLGLMPEKVETIQSLGMSIVPRTLCYNGRNDARYAQAVLEGYEKYGITPDYIIAGGEAVVGYDEQEDAFALDYIQSNNITVGLIETNVQRENIMQSGVEDIARATDYNMVRVFSVWDYIQFRYGYYGYQGAEEIENTLYRAIVERNIRIIYFKPIKQQDNRFAYVTDPQIYRDMFESLDQRLAAHSIVRGRASVLENVQVPPLAMLVLGLGAGIGGALLPATCATQTASHTV